MDSDALVILTNYAQSAYDSGWLALYTIGYLNSWATAGGPGGARSDAAIRLIYPVVYLAGTITGGASGSQVCSALPTLFSPKYTINAAGVNTATANSTVLVHVTTGGVMSVYFPSGTNPGLDGVKWLVS